MAKRKGKDFVDPPLNDEAFAGDLDDILDDPIEGETVSDEVELYAPLSTDEARQLTDTIRNAAEMLWMLIARAHAGKAWEALGFATWEAYVREEFDMSRSRSYQLLDQARVIAAIEAAVPDGTPVAISEAAARDLKEVLEDVVPDLRDRTEGLSPDEASVVLDEIVEEQRERLREERAAAQEEEVEEEYVGSGNGEYKGGDFDDDDLIYDDVDNIDAARIRRNVNAAHDVYGALAALASLPDDLEEVIAIIPNERHAQINGNLDKAEEKLAVFAELWRDSDVYDRADDEGDE